MGTRSLIGDPERDVGRLLAILGAPSDGGSTTLLRQQPGQPEYAERERRVSNAGDGSSDLGSQRTSPEEGVGQLDNQE